MTLEEAIIKLQEIYKNYGNCEMMMFDISKLSSRPVIDIKYVTQDQFRDDLKHEQSYVDNFNKELNNVTII